MFVWTGESEVLFVLFLKKKSSDIEPEYRLCEIIEGNSYSILCEIKCEVSFSA